MSDQKKPTTTTSPKGPNQPSSNPGIRLDIPEDEYSERNMIEMLTLKAAEYQAKLAAERKAKVIPFPTSTPQK